MEGVIYEYFIGGKYYVGKTYTQQRKRIDKHKYEAFTLKKDHPFCRAIRKYGWEATRASYKVIETVTADDAQTLNKMLIERESYWIEQRNSLVPNGYNIYTKGQEMIPHTDGKAEIYKRVSENLKGKYMNSPSVSRKVYCVEQQRWYPSISEAERQNNLAKGSVEKAASGKNVHAGNLTWNYTGANEPAREDLLRKQRKPIRCIETKEIFVSIYEATKHYFGEDAIRMKCRIQNGLRHGWAVNGLHFEHLDM